MRWPALTLLLGAAAGCTNTRVGAMGCLEDAECGSPVAAFRCDATTGVCFCRTNDACRPAEFCNTAGFCQDRAGCEKNGDCLDPSLFCDTTSGTCLSRGRCSTDLQCDLGQVCEWGSISVPALCAVEEHPGLAHLVSTVSGRLRPGLGWAAAIDATFPPGSVTGAPKVAALSHIAGLESVSRVV